MLECLLWTQPGTKAVKFRSSKCFPVCTSKQTQCVLPLAPSNGAREGRVLMILRCAIARVMKAKRPFGAHVCFNPKTGARADIPRPPLWARLSRLKRLRLTRPYFGGCKPGELAQSSKWDAVSARRAFLRRASRSGPGESFAACSRISLAHAASLC